MVTETKQELIGWIVFFITLEGMLIKKKRFLAFVLYQAMLSSIFIYSFSYFIYWNFKSSLRAAVCFKVLDDVKQVWITTSITNMKQLLDSDWRKKCNSTANYTL